MEYVYELLEKEKCVLLERIARCTELEKKAELIGYENLIDHSIKLLKKCDSHGVFAGSIFTKLPKKTCDTPSSEYRIIEDCETGDSQYWEEVQVKGKAFNCVRLSEGDVVIEN